MLIDARRRINDLVASLRLAEKQAERERQALATLRDGLASCEEARTVLQAIAEQMQQQASGRIAAVATRCLAAVFDDPYEVQIRFASKRGKTEASIVFVRDGLEFADPLNEVGGGCVDVAAFGLRLAALVLSRPRRRRLLVLDEPWKSLRGRGNRRRMRSLLESLAAEFDVQFVLNVDAEAFPEFLVGKVLELEK